MNVIVEMKRDDLSTAIRDAVDAGRITRLIESVDSERRQMEHRSFWGCLICATLSDSNFAFIWLALALWLGWRWFRYTRRALDNLVEPQS